MVALEVFAALTGILYLYFAVRERMICWGFYIVSALAYLPVLLSSGLVVYAFFQLLCMLAGLCGLFLWRNQSEQYSTIKQLSGRAHIAWNLPALTCLALCFVMLPRPNGSLNMLFDLSLSTYTLLTTLLTIKKFLENWLYWMAVNGVGIIASLNNQLYATATFFLINLVFSVIGYREWSREVKQQQYPVAH